MTERREGRWLVVLTLTLLACVPRLVHAQGGPTLNGLGVEERLDSPSALDAALGRSSAHPVPPLFVRLHVSFGTLADLVSSGVWTRLDDRLAQYGRHHAAVLIAVDDLPADASSSDAWRQVMRSTADHCKGRVEAYEIGGDTAGARPDPATYAFLLKLAAVEIRGADRDARVALAEVSPGEADWVDAVYRQDTAAYVDLVVVSAPGRADWSSLEALQKTVAADDPTAGLIVAGATIPGSSGDAGREWLGLLLAHLGTSLSRLSVVADADALVSMLAAGSRFADVLAGQAVELDEQAAALRLVAAGQDVTSRVPHRLLYNTSTLSTYLVYGPSASPLQIALLDEQDRRPVRRDLATGGVQAVDGFSSDPATHRETFGVPAVRGVEVLDFDYGAESRYTSRSDVAAAAGLSVAEVVFREQQERASEVAHFSRYIALARMEQHFRPTPTDVFDVVTTNRFFVDDGAVEWEELSFSLNGTRWGPDRPAFPMLQPEKVLSLPLEVRLTNDYRYRLDGAETVDGRPCYVVAFEPVAATGSFYRGRMWIDQETFRRVKVTTVQTKMAAPVVSSEETQWYGLVPAPGGQPVAMVTRVSTNQIFLIAGRNLLVEKQTDFSGFEIDPPDFQARRAAARTSDRIMYRDTDQGVRYLVKRGGQRVVSDRPTTSAKALAMGTTIDPSFDFPLPIFGLNYLNFAFLGPNRQLSLLFGGVLALGNIDVPRLGGHPLDASVDLFAIAVPGNNLVFGNGGELKGQRVMSIPFSTGVNLGYQFTPFQKVSVDYSFRYDKYFAAKETDAAFTVPSSTITNGAGVRYEYERHGYTIQISVDGYRRAVWKPWGTGPFDPATRDYRRNAVTVGKTFYPGPFQTLHASFGWYGGHDLDRFSMYEFGLFDEVRMHGVPAAGVRFPELWLGRLSYSFNVFDQYRLDLFLDQAAGRDRSVSAAWRRVTGAGIAVSLRVPWQAMLRVDVGKSFLPLPYRTAGSFVLQILLLKPL